MLEYLNYDNKVIARFNYQRYFEEQDDIKKIYNRKDYTKEELEKTKEIRTKIIDFIKMVNNEENNKIEYINPNIIYDYVTFDVFTGIQYLEGVGYISKVNTDYDIVNVYKYGDTFDEAFKTAIIEYAFEEGMSFYSQNSILLEQDYIDRFQDVVEEDDDYHGTFYFAEKGIQILRQYYKDNMPEDIIKYFEDYLKIISKTPAKYDYETNSFIRIEKQKQLNYNMNNN